MSRSEETAVLSLLHAGPGLKLRTGLAADAFGQDFISYSVVLGAALDGFMFMTLQP